MTALSQTQAEFERYSQELTALSRRDITQGIKLGKYKKSAQSLLKKDPVAANALLGLVACLEHDVASMHTYHKTAIGIGESVFSLMSYAVSLEKSCLWNESVRHALFALDYEPENVKVLDAIIRLAPLTGRFSLLKRVLPQWQQAHKGVPHPSQGDDAIVTEILSNNDLLEKDLKSLLTAIGDALSESDVILHKFRYDFVMERHNTSFIHYRFVVPDQFVASYYEDIVAEKLEAAQCHPRIFDIFSFSVENATVYELYDYMDREFDNSVDSICVPDPGKMKLMEELVEGVEV